MYKVNKFYITTEALPKSLNLFLNPLIFHFQVGTQAHEFLIIDLISMLFEQQVYEQYFIHYVSHSIKQVNFHSIFDCEKILFYILL